MAKKLKRLLKMMEKEEQEIKKEISQFYDDGVIVNIPHQEPFAKFMSEIRKESAAQTFTEKQMEDKSLQIRENVKQGIPNNIEIDLINGVHKHDGMDHNLGYTMIKAVEIDNHEPIYLSYEKGDIANALVFIGGEDAQAILALRDDEGTITYTRLSEFHLLSISKTDSNKEFGLMTSYLYATAKVFASVIFAPTNLNPIKSLLLSEAIRAKAFESAKTTELGRGDGNE